jgi:hypothetical protein
VEAPAPGRSTAAPPGAPPLDIERIADSVLGALDRRLIAHRERYGTR